MSEYAKTCSFCQQVIKMNDKDGKWLPYNKNGSTHDCKKLESLGIIMNTERLMKA